MTEVIRRDQWQAFAKHFSRQHRGWLVNVEAINTRELNHHPEQAKAVGRPLFKDAVLREVAFGRRGASIELRVRIGAGPNSVLYRIPEPVEVCFETTDEGAHQGLRVDAADGNTTLIEFRTPAYPETLDGLSDAEQQAYSPTAQ